MKGSWEFLWSLGSQENTVGNRNRKGMTMYWIAVQFETSD